MEIIKIGASLLARPEEMNEKQLFEKIINLEKSGIDEVHWDVMDGKYNPNNTWEYQGPHIIKKLRKTTQLPFVAHLMINNPLEKINLFNDSGCDIIVFHYEASKEIKKTISKIKSLERKVGIALEPETDVKVLDPYLSDLDYVLLMTVKTGYHGQKFIDKTDKIRYLVNKKEKGFEISIDGGINEFTGKICREAGATILSVASYLSNSLDYSLAIKRLKGLN